MTEKNKKRGFRGKDMYNIEFIRFFRLSNFIFALLGSIIGIIFLFNFGIFEWINKSSIDTLYFLLVLGGALFFAFLALIAYFAGNTKFESCRLAGRRGLFTFTVMLCVTLLYLIISKKITWESEFYYFVKNIISSMIILAFPAVLLDYGSGLVRELIKK